MKIRVPPAPHSSIPAGGSINRVESHFMPVQLICPNLRCRKFLAVPDEVRGKLVKCQSCQTLFRVPDTAKKPAAAAAGAPSHAR